ncbi:Der GTPase-activating protein YihI [Ferrimonas kyonanensis]|uniref:Der GTPase-activating protein YihI n=1 Tax=Ferrimonas kyonanensis TaxID=364763 RepID=UPI000425B630|nr:Der GTPase-activating protein YihI [Ferrimonas kyonanensis]
MTRQKKSRKSNVNGPRLQPRTEKGSGVEGKRKSSKGKSAGSRQNEASKQKPQANKPKVTKDPRLGSKTPISLVAPEPKPVTKAAKPQQPDSLRPKPSPEHQLEQLESNPRLLALLDRMEQGETLSQDDQQWLDGKLDRIEALMKQLGIEVDQGPNSEEALMDQFEAGSDLLDQYKD